MRPGHPVRQLDRLNRASNARLLRLIGVAKALDDDDYLHWEKLRHQQPPDGLSVEDWWLAIKLRRKFASIDFPTLTARNGEPLSVSRHPRVEASMARLDRQMAGQVATPANLDGALRDQFIASSLMEEAIHSSLFEGAVSTREDAKQMLRTDRSPINRDERMILNNYQAMVRLRELARSPLTLDLILELHRLLTDGTLDDDSAAGRIQRPDENRVQIVDARLHRVVHAPPPAAELPARLERLIAFANAPDIVDGRYVHPVSRSILLHFQMAYDHPFLDGNGRTARALFYWSMLRRGYWLVEFLSISRLLYRNRGPYERAYVMTETDRQDATYFVLQQLDVLCEAVDALHAYATRKIDAQRHMKLRLDARGVLNPRQLALLDHALRHPDARFTHDSHANSHRVSRVTARVDLLDLVKRKMLRRTRVGKQQIYVPTRSLQTALGQAPTTANSRTAAGTARRIPRK